ncbi:MAG TPA: hypothetical protein VE175_00700 [Woeseiaceae bacterium]|nr:hypothetical protein [Woeseiaceae bacterium]
MDRVQPGYRFLEASGGSTIWIVAEVRQLVDSGEHVRIRARGDPTRQKLIAASALCDRRFFHPMQERPDDREGGWDAAPAHATPAWYAEALLRWLGHHARR